MPPSKFKFGVALQLFVQMNDQWVWFASTCCCDATFCSCRRGPAVPPVRSCAGVARLRSGIGAVAALPPCDCDSVLRTDCACTHTHHKLWCSKLRVLLQRCARSLCSCAGAGLTCMFPGANEPAPLCPDPRPGQHASSGHFHSMPRMPSPASTGTALDAGPVPHSGAALCRSR